MRRRVSRLPGLTVGLWRCGALHNLLRNHHFLEVRQVEHGVVRDRSARFVGTDFESGTDRKQRGEKAAPPVPAEFPGRDARTRRHDLRDHRCRASAQDAEEALVAAVRAARFRATRSSSCRVHAFNTARTRSGVIGYSRMRARCVPRRADEGRPIPNALHSELMHTDPDGRIDGVRAPAPADKNARRGA